MKRLIVVAVMLLTLAALSAVTATSSSASVCQSNGTGCTKAGTYTENAVINSNLGGFKVVWVQSVVASYPSGTIPVKWTAYVHYINQSSSTLTLTCSGGGSGLTENLSGGSGDTGGYVTASYSQCSQNPGLIVNVPPGGTDTDWAVFGNVPWPGTKVALTWASVGTSPYIYPFGSGDTDWADSSFCSRSWKYAPSGAPYIGVTYKGVAACGNSVTVGNNQGPISYNGVYFDNGNTEPGVGFQCVELAARYYYFETTQAPPHPATGALFASSLSSSYNVYPPGSMVGTARYQSSLTAGNIISMWSNSDTTGHVAVVTHVSVSGGKGTIDVIDENASAKPLPDGMGNDTITVSGGLMSYEGLYNFFQWTTNLPGSG